MPSTAHQSMVQQGPHGPLGFSSEMALPALTGQCTAPSRICKGKGLDVATWCEVPLVPRISLHRGVVQVCGWEVRP